MVAGATAALRNGSSVEASVLVDMQNVNVKYHERHVRWHCSLHVTEFLPSLVQISTGVSVREIVGFSMTRTVCQLDFPGMLETYNGSLFRLRQNHAFIRPHP